MKELIEKFYSSFGQLDAEGMNSCYHPDVVFSDPAFGTLNSERTKAMWVMLCNSQKGKDFSTSYSNVTANTNSGSAQWEAHYTFSQTGRKVHNKIKASFEFKDGLIIKHTDEFNLHTWSKQSMGLAGALIGWSGFFRRKLQARTNAMLDKFINSRS